MARHVLRLHLDGRPRRVDLAAVSPVLAKAQPKQRRNVAASPARCGLHWPDLDEDLSLDGLIDIAHVHSSVSARAR